MAESGGARTIPHQMWRTTVLVAGASTALLVSSGGAAQGPPPRLLQMVDARACGAPAPVRAGGVVTISPDGDGRADCAALRLRLDRASTVELVVRRGKPRPGVAHVARRAAAEGLVTLVWAPPAATEARTYVTHISSGPSRERVSLDGPVIRVQGSSARFGRESYAPGDVAILHVDTRARPVLLEVVDAATDEAVAGPRRARSGRVGVRVGHWRPGVYVARLSWRDVVVASAPLVVRASPGSRPRVAVVLPTNTWQAYNFTDADADGEGDTWYASRRRESARLDRPYMGDGLPPFFHRYDLPFLRWLGARGHDADVLGDTDLDRVPDAAALARRYDLLVFPGHHEYVTQHELDLIEGFRDRGGNLAFLSADALHWRVERHGDVLRRKEQWRAATHPRPEAAIVGVQYRASDDGTHRGAYVVRRTGCAPWLFTDTGLVRGSRFGWSGVEISATTADSPAGTCVVAEIPGLLGPGRSAQMTYYETAAGARVFAAGSFCFVNRTRVISRLLDNLWARLARP